MADITGESPAPDANSERRSFFQRVGLALAAGLGLLATTLVAIPFIGYLLGPLRKKSAPWVNLGAVDKFPQDQTRLATFTNPLGQDWDGMTARTGVYVRYQGKDENNKDKFLIFAVNCAHLGCPVTWFPQSGLFMCPCHGGVYYEDGRHASGPPPRGLFHCEWQVRDGQLEVQAPHYPTLQHTLKDQA